jgi:Zinc-binding loop region of homing endonuclease
MSMNFGDPRLPQKFWARHEVTVNAGMSPCWTYTSFRGLGPNNRAIVRFGREKPTTNYRLTCDLVKGRLPEGVTCSHICHNPLCANPDHVVYETLRENMARKGTMHPRAAEIFAAKVEQNPSFRRSVKKIRKSQQKCIARYRKKRWASDPEFREKFSAYQSAYQKERYANNPEYRAKRLASAAKSRAKRKANKT